MTCFGAHISIQSKAMLQTLKTLPKDCCSSELLKYSKNFGALLAIEVLPFFRYQVCRILSYGDSIQFLRILPVNVLLSIHT